MANRTMRISNIKTGNALRLIRIAHDLSIKELSLKTGISMSYITEMEKNQKSPSENIIAKYSEGLGLSKQDIDYFLKKADADYSYQKFLYIILKKIAKI